MALAKQNIPLEMTQGLNRGTSDALRDPRQLSEGLNVEQLKAGRIQKRKGFETIFTDADARHLFARNGGIGYFDLADPRIVSFDGTTSDTINDTTDSLYRWNINSVELPFSSRPNDIIEVGSFLYVSEGTTIYKLDSTYNVVDQLEYGGRFIQGTQISVLNVSGTLVAYNFITQTSINLSLGALSGTFEWDACEAASGGFAIAFDDGSNIICRIFDSAGTQLQSTTLQSTALGDVRTVNITSVSSSAQFHIVVARGTNGGEVERVVASTGSNAATLTLTDNVWNGFSTGTRIVYERGASDTKADITTVWITTTASFPTSTPSSPSFTGNKVRLVSKPYQDDFLSDTVLYLYESLDASSLQNALIVGTVQSTNSRAAKLYSGSVPDQGVSNRFLPAWTELSDGRHVTCHYGRLIFKTPMADSVFASPIEFDGKTFFAGPELTIFDGREIQPSGFLFYPETGTPVDQGGGTGSIGVGTYFYVLVFRIEDNFGSIVRSAPSEPFSDTISIANNSVEVTTKPFNFQPSTFQPLTVELYRTLASGSAGSVYYRVGQQTLTGTGQSVTITDTTSDADLIDGEILYTTGGVVENIFPSNLSYLAVAKDRLWAVEEDATTEVWFSKQRTSGFLPEFSDLLKVVVDSDGGVIQGVAELDDKVFILKESVVFAVFGDGPSAALVGSFATPQPILQGMGCVNKKSIVETPQGVFFETQEGIYVIDRSLQASFVGNPIYKDQGTILSSAYDAEFNRVFWLSDSQIWCLCLTRGSWYEWTVTNPKDFLISSGKIYRLADSKIQRLGSTYQDDSANYEQKIKLGPFQFAGIQGYQRVYRTLFTGPNGGDADSSNITAKTFVNFDTTETDTLTIPHSDCIASNRFGIEVRSSRQRCEALEVELSLTSSTSGFAIDAGSAEVGALPGAGRRAASRRA